MISLQLLLHNRVIRRLFWFEAAFTTGAVLTENTPNGVFSVRNANSNHFAISKGGSTETLHIGILFLV
jgi:hypothetical protein